MVKCFSNQNVRIELCELLLKPVQLDVVYIYNNIKELVMVRLVTLIACV